MTNAAAATIIKVCSCGARYDHSQWLRLPFVGVNDAGDGFKLDLRNCSCHSTIAIELPEGVSVCSGCKRWLGTGDVKVAVEGEPIFCERCARDCGLIAIHVRRTAA